MTKESEAFEQRIHRMHELIEGSGAEVTWNDRLPDPDNPAQPRQIDITIKRGGSLTIVECRLHRERQDVKWIEELIGRKISLQADNAVAVSASGFTEGAIKKAECYDIALRDLQDLTPEEISGWGFTVDMKIYYYQYEDLRLVLLFPESSIAALDQAKVFEEVRVHPVRQSLFNASVDFFDSQGKTLDECLKKRISFKLKLRLQDFQLAGQAVEEVEFSGTAELQEMDVRLPVAVGYAAPQEKAASRDAVMQKASDSETGFILHAPDRLATIVDISTLKLPANAQFCYVRTTASKTVDMDSVELIGADKLYVTKGPMAVEIVRIPDQTPTV